MIESRLRKISKLSKKIGDDIDLIQGAGGNVSEKIGDDLWVKASGCWLSDALKENIFISVNYKNILKNIDNQKSDPVSSEVMYSDATKNLRPSIETTLHAIMPYKYVVHTHSINCITNTISRENLISIKEKMNNLNWSLVAYTKPGLDLARKIRESLRPGIDTVLMSNHGAVIGSNCIHDLEKKIYDLEKRLQKPLRNINKSPKLKELDSLVKNTDYSLPTKNIIHSLALDETLIKAVSNRSLYPDHVVFLGPGPMKIHTISGARKIVVDRNNNPEVMIIENFGVIVNKSRNPNVDLMLYCLASTLLRISSTEEILFLTTKDESDLLGWDAEDYRIALQNNRI